MPLTPGTRLGSYEIVSLLGAGGMGEVYKAKDLKLGRDVAIKVLREDLASDPERLRRFEQEARAASSLNHPNIVTIHDIGEHEGTRYIAMEYVEGKTLREMLGGEPLPTKKLLKLSTQIADGLAKAHSAGIVHRDLKPENLVVSEDGFVKILDFGLAKLVPEPSEVDSEMATKAKETREGVVLGTVQYMSPEQAAGRPVDYHSDQFSLGSILYEMATGRLAFQRETVPQTQAAIIAEEPEPVRAVNPPVPVQLARIIERCLNKDPKERYDSTRDLARDIKDVEEVSSVTSTKREPQATSSRRPVYYGIVAFVGIAAVIVLTTLLVRERSTGSGEAIDVVNRTQITSSRGLDTFPALSPDGNALAYSSNRSGSFEIRVRQLTPGGGEIQLTSGGEQNLQPAWSSDGQRIAYSRLGGGIWVVPALGGVARQVTEFGSRPAWSPDGERIAFQSDLLVDFGASAFAAMPPSTIWICPAEGGESRRVTEPNEPPGGHGAPVWSPDGQRIAFISSDMGVSAVWSVPSKGGKPTRLLERSTNTYIFDLLLSPGGDRLFFTARTWNGSTHDALWTVALEPNAGSPIGEPTQLASSAPSVIRHLTLSADGSLLAYTALSMTSNLAAIQLSPLSAHGVGEPRFVTHDTSERNNFPSFSPNGSTIAFRRALSGSGSDIWIIGADGENPRQLTAHEAEEDLPQWFPDGDRVLFQRYEDRAGLWSVSIESGREEFVHPIKPDWGYWKLSPDGQQVVFGSDRSGAPNLWTAPLRDDQARQLTFDDEMMAFPSWSPDGKHIALEMKRGADIHIAIIPAEGGTPTQLTHETGQSFTGGWSPDGDKIAFAGLREGYWNIWWVSRTTKEQRKLTDYSDPTIYVRYPIWSPRGGQIVYEYAETTGNIWIMELR